MLETERLILRRWRESDRGPFAALNADPRVCEHFPKESFSREESDALIDRSEAHFREHGFTSWCVEVKEGAPCIGFVGLLVPTWEAHFTPCVEIGWRLAPSHWGQGYATEGARAALRFGFEEADLAEIVALTVPANRRSWGVMERLGMTRDPADDFDHPRLPPGHELLRHVLYRLRREDWSAT